MPALATFKCRSSASAVSTPQDLSEYNTGASTLFAYENELSSFEQNGSEVLETRQRLIARYKRIETDEREKEVWENDFPLMQIYNPLKDIRNPGVSFACMHKGTGRALEQFIPTCIGKGICQILIDLPTW